MLDVVWDLETEGLNLGLTRPWQLAYIVAENGRIKKKENCFIDIHDLNISEKAAQVTRFSWEKYNLLKRPAEEIVDKFEEFLYDDEVRLIGHNTLGYDVYILANLYQHIGRKLDLKKIIYKFYDTLSIARAQHFQSPPPKDKYEFLAWQYKHLHKFDKSVKTSLSALAERNGIEVDKSKTHDALYDIEINYLVFKKLQYAIDLL